MKNRKLSPWTIAALAVISVIAVLICLRGCNQESTSGDPTPSISDQQPTDPNSESVGKHDSDTKIPDDVGEKEEDTIKEPDNATTNPGATATDEPADTKQNEEDTKPAETSKKPSSTTTKPSNETTKPEPETTEPGTATNEPANTEPIEIVTKSEPVEGVDYTIPIGLKGIAGEKLSSVSLGNSHLVWCNPSQVMSENKLCYQAKFVETSTKSEKIVTVSVRVTKKTDPVEGEDYTIPTGLKGTAGKKLSTVLLGKSHLVWKNPNEELKTSKSLYEAKFVETDTKNEKIVWVKVEVKSASNGDNQQTTTEPGGSEEPDNPDNPDKPDVPDKPDEPDNPDNPDNPGDDVIVDEDTEPGGGGGGNDTETPGTGGDGEGGDDVIVDEDTEPGGGGGDNTEIPGIGGNGDEDDVIVDEGTEPGGGGEEDDVIVDEDTEPGGGGDDTTLPGIGDGGDGLGEDDVIVDEDTEPGDGGGGDTEIPGLGRENVIVVLMRRQNLPEEKETALTYLERKVSGF